MFCMEEGSQQLLWAECLQKGQREQESGAADGEQVCSLFSKAAVALLDFTVISYRLPWNRNSLRLAAPSYPEGCRKKEIAQKDFHRCLRAVFKSELVHRDHLKPLHFHNLLAGAAGPRLSILHVVNLFAEYHI